MCGPQPHTSLLVRPPLHEYTPCLWAAAKTSNLRLRIIVGRKGRDGKARESEGERTSRNTPCCVRTRFDCGTCPAGLPFFPPSRGKVRFLFHQDTV